MTCDVCIVEFGTTDELVRHKRSTHNAGKIKVKNVAEIIEHEELDRNEISNTANVVVGKSSEHTNCPANDPQTKEKDTVVLEKKVYNMRNRNKATTLRKPVTIDMPDSEEEPNSIFEDSGSEYNPSDNEDINSDNCDEEGDMAGTSSVEQNVPSQSENVCQLLSNNHRDTTEDSVKPNSADETDDNQLECKLITESKRDVFATSPNSSDKLPHGKQSNAFKRRVSFLCSHCYKVCRSIESITLHMTANHNKQPDFNCLLCSENFADFQLLRKHFDSKHLPYSETSSYTDLDVKNKTIECPDCLQILLTPKSLHRHKLMYHDPENLVQCNLCKRNIHKSNMRVHVEYCAAKSVVNTVVCDQCGKKFKQQGLLRMHLKTHAAPAFECDVCKKKFATRARKTLCEDKHANIRRYKCKFCMKSFFYDHSLVHHTRIHTGERPYNCWICNRSFYSHQILLKHCLSHGLSKSQFRAEFTKRNGKSS